MDSDLELTVAIAVTVDKVLDRLEGQKCGATTVLIQRPWAIPVICNLIRGHSAEMHTDGASEWSD